MAPPSRRPWLIPAAMIVIFAAIVGVAVLAASTPSSPAEQPTCW